MLPLSEMPPPTRADNTNHDESLTMTTSETAAAPAPADDESLGLPNWLEDMMKPGVGAGVFLTLKLSLGDCCAQPAAHRPFLAALLSCACLLVPAVGLLLTLSFMISVAEDEVRARCIASAWCIASTADRAHASVGRESSSTSASLLGWPSSSRCSCSGAQPTCSALSQAGRGRAHALTPGLSCVLLWRRFINELSKHPPPTEENIKEEAKKKE